MVAAFVLDHLARLIVAMSLDFRKQQDLPLVYAGGVMSNKYIRAYVEKQIPRSYFAEPVFSADNAVGIAVLAAEAHEGR